MENRLARVETQLEGIAEAIKDISLSMKTLVKVEERQEQSTKRLDKMETKIDALEECAATVKLLQKVAYGGGALALTAAGTKLLSVLGLT